MSGKNIEIFDSSLRDGAQGEGISYSIEDKLGITSALDELGVKYIEAGNPASNKKDLEFFQRAAKLKLKNSEIVAFGSTRRKNSTPETDKNCQALLTANTKTVVIFGKCWELHVTKILKTTNEENLKMIAETCSFFLNKGKKVIFDAEHFYDGYKSNPSYALKALEAAVSGGAECLVLCDTNGGTFPQDIFEITKTVTEKMPDLKIGIHAHNDGGMAVANTIMAVKAGAVHVQGTFLGIGERCGNANLSTVIPNLQLKMNCRCIPEKNVRSLTSTAFRIAEIANITLHKNLPYVGRSAFAHKAGMHADGVLKLSESFEHVNPALVGNTRRFLMSEVTGKSAVLKKINKIYPEINKNSEVIRAIINELKEKEYQGFQYESADSSFELIIRKHIGKYRPFFDLVSYRILDEQPKDNGHSATATLKVRVNGQLKIAAAEGDGPVNALDVALREALSEFYPCLGKVRLIDYKVRVMEPKNATAATVRVLFTSTDGNNIWTTVGVSQDVIEASWMALVDSIEYKLCHETEKGENK